MPMRARIMAAAIAHHIIQRGNNRSVCFYAADDNLLYLQLAEVCVGVLQIYRAQCGEGGYGSAPG
ncbi:MAG: hypothetical protein ACI9LY_002865 [Arenicella sp.]|jgi:hypothetical protein